MSQSSLNSMTLKEASALLAARQKIGQLAKTAGWKEDLAGMGSAVSEGAKGLWNAEAGSNQEAIRNALIGAAAGGGLGGLRSLMSKKKKKRTISDILQGALVGGGIGGGGTLAYRGLEGLGAPSAAEQQEATDAADLEKLITKTKGEQDVLRQVASSPDESDFTRGGATAARYMDYPGNILSGGSSVTDVLGDVGGDIKQMTVGDELTGKDALRLLPAAAGAYAGAKAVPDIADKFGQNKRIYDALTAPALVKGETPTHEQKTFQQIKDIKGKGFKPPVKQYRPVKDAIPGLPTQAAKPSGPTRKPVMQNIDLGAALTENPTAFAKPKGIRGMAPGMNAMLRMQKPVSMSVQPQTGYVLDPATSTKLRNATKSRPRTGVSRGLRTGAKGLSAIAGAAGANVLSQQLAPTIDKGINWLKGLSK